MKALRRAVLPVHQSIFSEVDGNCVAACLASILHWPIESIPNFVLLPEDVWDAELERWFRRHGVQVRFTDIEPPGYCVALGTSWRGTDHAVVMYNGRQVFDPNPYVRPGLQDVEEYIAVG